MGLRCTLRSVLRQDPITPNSKRPTCDGAPLHAEVSVATGPLSIFSLSLSLSLSISPIRPVVSLLLLTIVYLRVVFLPTDIAATKRSAAHKTDTAV